jgi:hypothetical protein
MSTLLRRLERSLEDDGMIVELYTSNKLSDSEKAIRSAVRIAREMIVEMIESHKNDGAKKPTDAQALKTWKTIGRHELPGKDIATIVLHDPVDRAFVHSIRETSQLIVAITDIQRNASPDEEEDEEEGALELASIA